MAWLARFLALVVCFTALATAVGAAEVKGKELELCGTFSNIFQYTLRVEIGTPPVPFDLTFDTGRFVFPPHLLGLYFDVAFASAPIF
jgi:hypothetical protein